MLCNRRSIRGGVTDSWCLKGDIKITVAYERNFLPRDTSSTASSLTPQVRNEEVQSLFRHLVIGKPRLSAVTANINSIVEHLQHRNPEEQRI